LESSERNRKAQHDISRKLNVLNYAKENGNIAKTCRYFGTCRETFYQWRRAYEAQGEDALINSKPCPVNSINFINYVVQKFPFRIKMIRTDNGHEFQTKFHWHVGELGMIHVYIKPATLRLNGKVERSHLTDQREFYQMLDYNSGKIIITFSDHTAHMGKTPYEKLKQRMLG